MKILTEEETSMNFIPTQPIVQCKMHNEDDDIKETIEASPSDFDDRFGANPDINVKREQSKTLTLLKLAKVEKTPMAKSESESPSSHLSENDL
jgi:hypothetical protein